MSRDMVYEEIPRLSRRLGDAVFANENNATILLGRDRNGSVDSGYGSLSSATKGRGAGSITAVVGRKSEDPSVKDDAASLYLSAVSDPDSIADTEGVGLRATPKTQKSTAVVRADCTRISSRVDVKISCGKSYICMTADGTIEIDGRIFLTKEAAASLIKGEAFQALYNVHTHIVTSPGNPTSPPQIPMTPAVLNMNVRC